MGAAAYGGDVWSETKAAALANLSAWIPLLRFWNAGERRQAATEAVATWRRSTTGRPLARRKRNLSISGHGIKDFGTSGGHSD